MQFEEWKKQREEVGTKKTSTQNREGASAKFSVVPSESGAKVAEKLESTKRNYENALNKPRGFITNVAQALGLEQHEASQYGTFKTEDGKEFTLRISNHNASVSNFDESGESEGVSIVISKYGNRGIRNNGTAHVSEFFYPKSAIERAEGKPLAVFRSATHIGSHVILTELKHKGKNFVAALRVNKNSRKLEINDIRSLHYRNDMNIVNWINEDLADYIKPSFAEEWFEPMKNELRSKPQYNSAEVRTQLVSAANKIKSFENPKQNDGNLRLRTSEELDRDYPNWNDTQTTSKGGHSTQITGTVSTSV